MVHKDNNGNAFISLSTAQFIVSIIIVIVTILGVGYNMHSRIYASVIEVMKDGDKENAKFSAILLQDHDNSIKSHEGLHKMRDKKIEDLRDEFQQMRKENIEFKNQMLEAIHKLDKKIR